MRGMRPDAPPPENAHPTMKIIADSAIPFLRGVLEPYAEVEYLPGSRIDAAAVRTADALAVRTRTRCDAALLAGSRVRLIATATIGFDHIDTAWCRAQGIGVATAAGCNARGVLQWVAAVLARLSARDGWHPAERTLGVVGVGHVGSLVAHYAAAWGFRVVCCDPPREARERLGFRTLEETAAEADILTFHTPLDDTTRHMASAALFARMKPGATILNSSRGEVADGEALHRSGLRYALDVWEHEPRPDAALLAGALLATPHVAGYSLQGKANATALTVRALAAHFGWPLADWYPADTPRSCPRPIAWQEMCATMPRYFDIAAQSDRLKAQPADFEALRDNYRYREEYF